MCFLTIIALFGTALAAPAGELPVAVERSRSNEIDALVADLVSKRPAPYPTGYWPGPTKYTAGYMTADVQAAIRKLKEMGPKIFPVLVTHLRDDRYSYSRISAAWHNHDVGDAVVEILSDGHLMHSGYKWRSTASGSGGYLSFRDYLDARNPEKWAEWASTKSRLEIQLDFIDWCIGKEQQRGFTDDAQQKQILGNYQRAREAVRKEYAEPARAKTNRKPPMGNSSPGNQPTRASLPEAFTASHEIAHRFGRR